MNKFLSVLIAAFSMFSRIPMPQRKWDETAKRYMMAAFPLIGVIIGLVILGWGHVVSTFEIPSLIAALVFMLIPLVITGGIHYDGLCDTVDALASRASKEKKLLILADPHIGAFGVITLVCHLLTLFVLFVYFESALEQCIALASVFVVSRTLSAWAVLKWKSAKNDGLVHGFHSDSSTMPVTVCLFAWFLAGSVVLVLSLKFVGLSCITAAFVMLAVYRFVAYKQFGGITGDTAGWFLQWVELIMIAVLVVGGLIL